ncbi:hypothetical protein JCM17961_28290 [Endothiovibrio diazotrophicus]
MAEGAEQREAAGELGGVEGEGEGGGEEQCVGWISVAHPPVAVESYLRVLGFSERVVEVLPLRWMRCAYPPYGRVNGHGRG